MFYNFVLKHVILPISKYGEDTSPGRFTSLVAMHVAIILYTIYHLIMVVGSLIKCYSMYTEYRCTLSTDRDCSIYSQLVLLFTLPLIWFCTIFTIDIRSIFFNGCLTNSQFTTISIDSSLFLISVLSHIFLSLVFPNQLFFCFTFK